MLSERRPVRVGTARTNAEVSSERLIPAKEALTAAVALLALLCIAYWNVIFFGKSVVYTDNYNPLDHRSLEQNYGPGFLPAAVWQKRNLLLYPNFHDAGGPWWQWEPAAEFFRKGLASGELPFWDPYVGAGAPSMANLIPAHFFPPHLLVVLLGDTSHLKNAYFLSLLLMAGCTTYLFLRKHGLSYEASFFGAGAFMFCGGLNQNVGSFIGQTAASIPVALYVTRRFLDRPTLSRTMVLALVYAGASLASFPPVLAPLFALSALYASWMICASRLETVSILAKVRRYCLAVAFSLGLVAWYYLPAFSLLQTAPYVAEFYRHAGLEFISPTSFYQLVSPVLMGGNKVYGDPAMKWSEFLPILPYVGIVPVLASLLGTRSLGGKRAALFTFTTTSAALVSLKLLGVAPIQWIGALPGLNTIHFSSYLGIPLNFLLAVLAALGLESLLARKLSAMRTGFVFVSGLVIVLSLREIAADQGALEHFDAKRWAREWWVVVALMTCFCSLALLSTLRQWKYPSTRKTGLLVIAVLFLEAIHNTAYPRQQRWDIWRHPVPYVEKLRAEVGRGRVFAVSALSANTNSPFEIASLDSLMTFNSPRVSRLYKKYAAPKPDLFLREATALPPEGVLDCANIEYVAVREAFPDLMREAETRDYETFFSDEYVRLFRRNSPTRYYFTSSFRVASATEALEAIANSLPQREVILETEPTFSSQPNRDDDPQVRILEFRRNSYTLSVRAPRPGLIYLSESSLPGWTARVNGANAAILPANYAFRAVEVPAGDVLLALTYWPPGLTVGLLVSTISGVLILGVFASGCRRNRRQLGQKLRPG